LNPCRFRVWKPHPPLPILERGFYNLAAT